MTFPRPRAEINVRDARLRGHSMIRVRLPAEARGALRLRAIRAGFAGNEIGAYTAALVLKALGVGECRACERLFRQPTEGALVKTCPTCKARARAVDDAAAAAVAPVHEDVRIEGEG